MESRLKGVYSFIAIYIGIVGQNGFAISPIFSLKVDIGCKKRVKKSIKKRGSKIFLILKDLFHQFEDGKGQLLHGLPILHIANKVQAISRLDEAFHITVDDTGRQRL